MLAFCIMDIQTAAKYAQEGYRITRTSWGPDVWISADTLRRHPVDFSLDDLLADDWQIITDGIVRDFPITYSD